MKKIIICPLPLKKINPRKYNVEGNCIIKRDEELYFAINSGVAASLEKDDELKVVLIETKGGDNKGSENAKLFIDELNSLNKVGAAITKEVFPTPFDETKTNFKKLFLNLVKELEEGSEIYLDLTYGPKPLALLLFSFLRFAEKHFNCNIGYILYSKVEFDKENKIIPGSECIYDITPLFMLNSFINIVDSDSCEEAVKSIEGLLKE